eukprot:CAMPEP_0178546030 /NCGR_PEP_ID=MMETSP0697-20121206/3946_1 /TAXON_ID=265572 /ORGANISM="Extubocellulus spinifer, Strain CCMP396" /LENGTH=383 /DNA_ID=CAMNT_0020178613 /DNA_START=36 /DNA_END=1187 /DNA_ORIENTATION=-
MAALAAAQSSAVDDDSTCTLLFDNPCFFNIHAYLDVKSALRLRSTSRTGRDVHSDARLAKRRIDAVLPAAVARRTLRRPMYQRSGWYYPCVDDAHIGWLFDYPANAAADADAVAAAAAAQQSNRSSSSSGNQEQQEVAESEHAVEEDGMVYPTDIEIDFRDAPLITDALLRRIAAGPCGPNVKSFSVDRGSNDLRITYDLRALTTDGPLALIQSSPCLETLCLSWCEYVRGDILCAAIATAPCRNTLRYLNLDGIRDLTDEAIESLAACTELRSLLAKDTPASDLSPLAACTKLEELHVCRGRDIRPDGVVAACAGFRRSIRILCCMGSRLLDYDTALHVLRTCPILEEWLCVRGTGLSLMRVVLRDEAEVLGRADIVFDNPH